MWEKWKRRRRWTGPGILTLAILILALLILAVFASIAQSNSLPKTVRHGPTGALLPGRETAVGVVEERLFFDFGAADSENVIVRPNVTVEYVLQNPSGQDETLEVAFYYLEGVVFPYDPKFTVIWMGREKTVNLETVPPGAPAPPLPSFSHELAGREELGELEIHWLDPRTGEVYEKQAVTTTALAATVFTLTVGAGEQGTLQVKYRQSSSGFDRSVAPTWHYTYLLSPARRWAFFKALTIRVQAPFGAAVVTEPKLERIGGRRTGVQERRFDGLPEGELHISVRSPAIVLQGALRYLWFLLAGLWSSPVFLALLAVGILAAGTLTWRRHLRQR